jgi:hypothetical protein
MSSPYPHPQRRPQTQEEWEALFRSLELVPEKPIRLTTPKDKQQFSNGRPIPSPALYYPFKDRLQEVHNVSCPHQSQLKVEN